MESKWAATFYRLVSSEIRDGIDEFLSRVLGDDWIDTLNENATARHSKDDPRASLLLLSRPSFVRVSVRKTLEKESSNEVRDAANSVRYVLTRIAHFRPVSDRQILHAMHAANQLLMDIKQEQRAYKFSEAAHALWAESLKEKDVQEHSSGVSDQARNPVTPPPSETIIPVPAEPDVTRTESDTRADEHSPAAHPVEAPDIPASNKVDRSSQKRQGASREITKPAAEGMSALSARDVQAPRDPEKGTSGLIVPPEWHNTRRRNQRAPSKPVISHPRPRIGRRGRRVALVLSLVIMLISVVFYVGRPDTRDDMQVDAITTQPQLSSPPVAEGSQAERIQVVLGVEKVASAYPIPNGQREIIIKPTVGNAANQYIKLRRNQIRLLVEGGSFDPSAWLPPGGMSSAGVPVMVPYEGRNIWSIPLNDTGLFEQMSDGNGISWATIFYDGTDGYEWDIAPSQQSAKAWQLTFYIPESMKGAEIVGFGLVDVEGQQVGSIVPISQWPEFGCVCDWWA